jgi:Mce-associated membrane protein
VNDPKPAAWRLLDFVLIELILIAALWALAVAIGGAAALPWQTDAERVGHTNRAVAAAAEHGVETFLDVDFRRVDKDSDDVMKLSTNPFREQYYNAATDLRIAAMNARSVSTGKVRSVGVSSATENTATVLVAADTVVTSARAKGPTRGHYRFIVTLQKLDGAWLMSGLAEAP